MSKENNGKRKPLQGVRNLMDMMGYSLGHIEILRDRRVNQEVKNILMLVNMELGKMDQTDPLYVQRVAEFDRVMIELTRAKWATSIAMHTDDKADWKHSTELYKGAKELTEALFDLVKSGSSDPLDVEPIVLSDQGTEILFADGAPLVSPINPIIVLQGSDRDMGYQYAEQLVDIFGDWVLARHAGIERTGDEINAMRHWEAQIKEHAPEFIPFFEGWVEGAQAAGIAMTYDDVLDLWTGHKPPANGYIGEDSIPELGHPLCSGLAAWGRATTDGELVTGSSGDHDIGHTVTVVAYPEIGNAYIFAPFGADGSVPNAGPLYFFGHPGMNDKGLAYVHHGGGPKMIEPKGTWGYGIRRGIAVLHTLRFCDNVNEAREMNMAFPVGEAGMGDPATAGGYYADGSGAFSIESMADPVIVRESGVLGETDSIYATNAPMHPDVKVAPWMQVDPEGWEWSAPGGWRPKEFKEFSMRSMENPHILGMQWGWFSAYHRNVQAFEALSSRVGSIDINAMIDIYCISGTIPEGEWKQIAKDYAAGKWSPAVGNSSNALVVIMKPEDGIYMHCVGEVKRGLAPMSAKNSSPLYDETNTFWEIRLADSLSGMVNQARKLGENAIQSAGQALNLVTLPGEVNDRLHNLLQTAQAELAKGDLYLSQSDDVATRARALRAFTRAQVRAGQVVNVLTAQEKHVLS